ncbi:hypothetical protein [Massilia sp. CCM 8734]|uniref:hypothetical protein n=1 Tax=Massilia sp. CCM 8734 TaxID=2609283 RepID=UPI0014241602|nr:hypothetical protein [Massilia sp. CCM 8734]NHZ97580.1 hypothetical protein [Massilia sp. CCM 8734]
MQADRPDHACSHRPAPPPPLAIAIGTALALGACGSHDDHESQAEAPLAIPAAPPDQGAPDSVPLPDALAIVDTAATNQRGDARRYFSE